MSELQEFTVSSARSLPVILLADVSGSMSAQGKIDALNSAVADMIASFAEEDEGRVEIRVAIITFGHGKARVHKPLQPASQVTWQNMEAKGRTPMGAAFEMAFQMLEDRQQVPSRAYAPTLVLISDGQPTDEWKEPLERLLSSERASKAARFAMAIGDDADVAMLREFLASSSNEVFMAHEAREIKKFFRWVTMSVTFRSRSNNPNKVEPTEFGDFDY
jgi:uncharacterized protein YegL